MGNLAAGKRNLLINDVSGAVSSFAEACKVGILLFHLSETSVIYRCKFE